MKNFGFSLVMAILYIILGLLMVFMPAASEFTIVVMLGVLAIVDGVVCIARYLKGYDGEFALITDLLFGILLLISGIYVLFNPEPCAAVFPFVWGVFMIVDAIIGAFAAIRYRNIIDIPMWLIVISIVIPVVLGILLIIKPFPAIISIIVILGVFITVMGIINLFSVIYLHHQIKKAEKTFHSIY